MINAMSIILKPHSLKIPTNYHITNASLETSDSILEFDQITLLSVPRYFWLCPVKGSTGNGQILETRGLLTEIGLHRLSGERPRGQWKQVRTVMLTDLGSFLTVLDSLHDSLHC